MYHADLLLTFSLQIVEITSSGGVPNNSVMIENWWTSTLMHDAMLSRVYSNDLDLFTYDPFQGTKVCLQASLQRYIQHSRYQLDGCTMSIHVP